jgi:hypothetical protein
MGHGVAVVVRLDPVHPCSLDARQTDPSLETGHHQVGHPCAGRLLVEHHARARALTCPAKGMTTAIERDAGGHGEAVTRTGPQIGREAIIPDNPVPAPALPISATVRSRSRPEMAWPRGTG